MPGGEMPGLPDWPIVRHLTWREAHMAEIGAWIGLGVAIAAAGGEWGVAVGLVVLARRRMQSDDQRKASNDLLPGLVRDAWYLGAACVVSFFACSAAITGLGVAL